MNYDHKKLIETLARLDEVPSGQADYATWIAAQRRLSASPNFLSSQAPQSADPQGHRPLRRLFWHSSVRRSWPTLRQPWTIVWTFQTDRHPAPGNLSNRAETTKRRSS